MDHIRLKQVFSCYKVPTANVFVEKNAWTITGLDILNEYGRTTNTNPDLYSNRIAKRTFDLSGCYMRPTLASGNVQASPWIH